MVKIIQYDYLVCSLEKNYMNYIKLCYNVNHDKVFTK